MKQLQTIVKEFLDAQDWFYQETTGQIDFPIEVEDYRLFCSLHILEENQQVVFYSLFPIKIPKNKTIAVIILLNQINSETVLGNFELDTEGNVRCRTSIDVENTTLNAELLENMLLGNFNVSVENYPKLLTVLSKKHREKKSPAHTEHPNS
jgi:hypothetical protein